jgi:mannose-6-phosphate isomerase-like protein (cupin superfamily)
MAYTVAGIDDVDSLVPEEWGGMWFLRDALGCDQLGVTLLELEPGGKGKEHDHAGTDHEEVYLVVDGKLTVELGDDTVTLGDGEAVRVDPTTTRQLHNTSEERVRVVVAGAP